MSILTKSVSRPHNKKSSIEHISQIVRPSGRSIKDIPGDHLIEQLKDQRDNKPSKDFRAVLTQLINKLEESIQSLATLPVFVFYN